MERKKRKQKLQARAEPTIGKQEPAKTVSMLQGVNHDVPGFNLLVVSLFSVF
jgi:hypothetical protein